MEKPKIYTKQDADALCDWFKSRELPKSLQVDKATFIPNLRITVDSLCECTQRYWNNPRMAGYLLQLDKIKKVLEQGEAE